MLLDTVQIIASSYRTTVLLEPSLYCFTDNINVYYMHTILKYLTCLNIGNTGVLIITNSGSSDGQNIYLLFCPLMLNSLYCVSML